MKVLRELDRSKFVLKEAKTQKGLCVGELRVEEGLLRQNGMTPTSWWVPAPE